MTVDRCVCHDLAFAQLLRTARAGGLDFAALRKATGCATNCARCEPYIRLMLETGRTSLSVLPDETVRRILRGGGDDPTEAG